MGDGIPGRTAFPLRKATAVTGVGESRQASRQTNSTRGRQTDRFNYRQADRQGGEQTGRDADRHPLRLRETDRDTESQTGRLTNI